MLVLRLILHVPKTSNGLSPDLSKQSLLINTWLLPQLSRITPDLLKEDMDVMLSLHLPLVMAIFLLTEELICNVVTELLVQWRNATMELLMQTFLMLAVPIALHQDVVTILLTREKNATEVHIALMFAQLACGSTITESRTTMELLDQCNHQSDSLKLALLDAH